MSDDEGQGQQLFREPTAAGMEAEESPRALTPSTNDLSDLETERMPGEHPGSTDNVRDEEKNDDGSDEDEDEDGPLVAKADDDCFAIRSSESNPLVSRREREDIGDGRDEDGEGRLEVVNIDEEDYIDKDAAPDPLLDKRVRRKLDWILLPFLALLFLLNSLDKSNIGNAESAGFTRDAGLSPDDINLSLGVFFAFFVTLQPVGAAFGRKFGMRRWVPGCMSLWGVCTLLHILVRKRWQLILLRICIAILEAGFYPTTVSYLSLFYTRYEFAVRLGVFYGQTAVAGVLGGVLGWAVFSGFESPDQPPTNAKRMVSGWKSWEALFLLEGCMTMFVALVGFFWLPRSANTAWFFTPAERGWAERRIQIDRSESMGYGKRNQVEATTSEEDPEAAQSNEESAHADSYHHLLPSTEAGSRSEPPSITADAGLTRQDVVSAFFNYKIWHLLVCNILSAIPATAFGVFLPLVIKQLSPSFNLTPAASNLLSAPPFACGAVAVFVFTRWSDRSRLRLIPILCGLGVLLIGVTMMVATPLGSYVLRYIALCVLLSGSFIASPLTVAWLTNNTPEPGKRAILLGINGWGNFAGVFLSVLFTPADRKTGYTRPLLVTLICVLASFAGFIAFSILLVRENKWRKEILAAWTPAERAREDRHGDAEVPESTVSGLQKRLRLDVLAHKLGSDGVRRGDERMTFEYGL